jgi:hypothetical protein
VGQELVRAAADAAADELDELDELDEKRVPAPAPANTSTTIAAIPAMAVRTVIID